MEDPRIEHCQRHKRCDILVLAVCAMIASANDFVGMQKFGRAKQDWLKKLLEVPNGIPSHDTLGRVFSLLDGEQFIQCFLGWVQTIHQVTAGEVVAVDGKTARDSLDRAKGQNPLHLVSAWASANRVVPGEVMVDDKSNEITAIPKLLQMLELHGAIVTIDAMGCQKEIAAKIRERGADYVLAVKGEIGGCGKSRDAFSWFFCCNRTRPRVESRVSTFPVLRASSSDSVVLRQRRPLAIPGMAPNTTAIANLSLLSRPRGGLSHAQRRCYQECGSPPRSCGWRWPRSSSSTAGTRSPTVATTGVPGGPRR